MKRIALAIFLVFLGFAISPAQAVRLAQNEAAQVAIVPLFNTLGGMDTLLKVSNGPAYSAVRVQLRNSDGQRIEAFNIYLAPNEAWGAALTERPDGPVMTKTDPMCILGIGGTSAVNPLQTEIPLSSAFGYIEILLMGHVEDPDVQFEISSRSCEALAGRFAAGPWEIDGNDGVVAPSNALQLLAQLINVERGTLYGLESVHLAEFRDRPFHVPPAQQFGLSDVHDQGTLQGETSSLVCDGTCETKTWVDRRDAVASLFLAVARSADYGVNPAIGASSSFVILNPMHPYYADGEFPDHETGLFVTDSDSGILNFCISFVRPPPTSPLDICPRPIRLEDPEALSSFSIPSSVSSSPVTAPLPILGIPGLYPDAESSTIADRFISGTFRILFLTFDNPSLISNDQSEFFGLPSIVLGFTEYQNGELFSPEFGAVRANYGTSAPGIKIETNPED